MPTGKDMIPSLFPNDQIPVEYRVSGAVAIFRADGLEWIVSSRLVSVNPRLSEDLNLVVGDV